MKIYETKDIRNVAVLGHGGCGKTTIVEAMAYITGVTNRMGKVADGNTISDFDKEEIKRQFSIGTSVVPIEHNGVKINLLDTPGYFDFVGEVEEAMSVAGAAVIVVNGKAGVQVGTQKAWDFCEKNHLPRLIFVTNMDDDNASYKTVVAQLEELYGPKIAPFHLPIRANEKFVGFVNVVKMKGRRFTEKSEYEECEIPDYVQDNLAKVREELMEAVAETSEEFLERYLSGDTFSEAEVRGAVRSAISDGAIIP
ncbi:MAG: GTP-binding protein, partial [Lachnospiraceae bacterium]|nr:GTP-binding protein [Lachnospiraceae bacterium]